MIEYGRMVMVYQVLTNASREGARVAVLDGATTSSVQPTSNLNHPGATTKVKFAKAGVYTFKTRAGEDYMKGIKTIGEDNVLRLTVTVR